MLFRFILFRLFRGAAVIALVSMLVFGGLRLMPGDPVLIMTGDIASPERIAELRRELRLDRPVHLQYWAYIQRVMHGDFGRSLFTKQRVIDQVSRALPASILLTSSAMAIALPIGGTLGLYAGYRRGTVVDSGVMAIAVLGVCIPAFWLGLMLIQLFAVQLGWLPSGGGPSLRHLILPALTLAASPTAYIARVVRSSVVEELTREHVRTARAKGIRDRSVLLRHVLRNAAIPVVTVFGLFLGTLLAGAVVTETVFSWPGLGRLLAEAVYSRDYPVVQALILVFATIFVIINIIVDILYALLDPRVRLSR